MRTSRARLDRLEHLRRPSPTDNSEVEIGLWAKLLRLHVETLSDEHLTQYVTAAINECARRPLVEWATMSERLTELLDRVDLDPTRTTTPELARDLDQLGTSPEIAVALLLAVLDELPPSRPADPSPERDALLARLNLT